MAGRLALVGSGEYLPILTDVEDWLLADNERVYVQLATASAPEGDARLGYWHDLGRQAAERIDARQVVVDIRTRDDAFDERWIDIIHGAGLIYLSGGNPRHLSDTLRDTPAGNAILQTWRDGAGLAGCSAGAMTLGGVIPDFRHPRSNPTPGIAAVPDICVLPHFDRYTRWMTALREHPDLAGDATLVGIDEDTALVAADSGEPEWHFHVRGRQGAYVVAGDESHAVVDGLRLRVSA